MIIEYNDCFFDYYKKNITEFNVDYLKNNGTFLNNFVYILNDVPVGLISYSIIYDRIELEYLWVDKKYRNKGIASLLLDYMFNVDNVSNITLEVRVSNLNAINLYKKKGFKICAVRKNYYNGEDAYLMIREMM